MILIDNANNSAISGWGNSLDNVLCGNNSNNAFYGRDGNDIEFGGKGNDSLIGGTGNDTLFGESGNDALDGGVGNDILNGGIGADSISTGVGRDVIKYENKTDSGVGSSNRDVITDFDANFDVIDLWQLSNKLTFIGTNAYSGKPGEIHYTSVMSTIVSIDFDGDKKSDFEIELMGYQTLSIDDFVFVQPK